MRFTNIEEIRQDGVITLTAIVDDNKEREIIFQSPFEDDLEKFNLENCILWSGSYIQVSPDKYPFERDKYVKRLMPDFKCYR